MAPQSPRHKFAAPSISRTSRYLNARPRCERLEDRTTPAAVFNVQNPLSFTGLSNNGFVAVGDLNKDGLPDAVLTNFGSGYGAPQDTGTPGTSITVLYGRQGGGFTRAQLNTGGTNVSFAAIADINGDGWLDVVAVNANQQNTGSVAVFRNDGITGTLNMVGSPISTFGNNSSWVGLADMTGDNVLDLVVASFGKANGNESVTGQSVTIFQGNSDAQGKGNFTFSGGPITTLVPELQFIPTSLAIADFDGDGIRDIAAAVPGVPPDFDQPQPDGNVYVFKGTGGGGFAAPNQFDTGGALPVNIQAADVNGDGKPDLIVANAGDPNANPEFNNDSVGVLLNATQTSVPNFAVATSLTANTYGTFAVAVADFNMDGKQDIAAVNYGSQALSPAAFVSFYQGNGQGTFTAGSPGTYDTKTNFGGGQYLAVGDFDGNGTPDLIVAHATNRVGMLMNTTPPPAVAPTVTGVTTNDGTSAQRSRVTSLSVTFSGVVVLPSNPASAFTLTYTGTPGGGAGGVIGSTVGGFSVTTSVVNGVTVATLSNFTGTDTTNGSLIDGRYSLKVTGSAVTINGTPMAADYTFADSGSTTGNQLYRLFGDADGNRSVNQSDLTLFRTAFGATLGDPAFNLAFDVDGDGVINQNDLAAFRTNFGATV